MSNDDTIAAPATSLAPSGIAIVRVSGPNTSAVLQEIFRGTDPTTKPREMVYGSFVDTVADSTIDTGMAVFMPGPRSYTGEDTAELHLHGSPIIVSQLLNVIYKLDGVRAAEPGEFTKRAFLNGKLDLVQAEAVSDLISATSERALKLAQEQLEGRFSSAIEEIGEPLKDTLAELEASIDFPEEDIDPDSRAQLETAIATTTEKVEKLLASYKYGLVVREGFRVLLCGRPNVGKSSLLNALLGQNRAIVTDISGTTRDLIEEAASFNGYRFVFCDSAGITSTDDHVEKIGIELAKERIPWADLILLVADSTQDDDWREVYTVLGNSTAPVWLIANKADLEKLEPSSEVSKTLALSAKTGDGVQELIAELTQEVSQSLASSDHSQVVTNERQRTSLEQAAAALKQTQTALKDNLPLEFVSAELRIALNHLEELVGSVSTEDILGRIFSKFCIGK